MANKRTSVITENVLRTRGIEVTEYTEEVSIGVEKMEIDQVFGFKKKSSNLYSTISRKRRDSYFKKDWEMLGIDPLKEICFVKRTL